MTDSEINWIKNKKIIRAIFITICSILILSSTAIAQELHVSSSRYSIFAPWTNKASDASLSANFTAYALLLDNNGSPVSGQSITFKIYSTAGLKATKTNITQKNGLASISYDTFNDFTTSTDTDYGTWRIEASLTGNSAIRDSSYMRIEAGGSTLAGCNKDNCHKTDIKAGAKPLSPYTDGYGATSSRAVASHKKSSHNKGCYICHPGYAAIKTGNGYTGDVHKNRTCDYCHGNWAYISSTGNGIPKMPGCSDCHPIFNNNVMNLKTLANLAAGANISVYSYNYDRKAPLTAHNGTVFSLADSVPCIVCHGPAHNNSKPYNAVSSRNNFTENEQCWTCHTSRATTHKSNINCVSCHSQDAHSIISAGGGPDCLSCHNTGGSAAHKVDGNAIASGEHANLNSNATANGVSAANKKCWGCHQTGGTQPEDMGDRYQDPYKCYDCHNVTKPYSNVSNALTVQEHFKNGIDIKAAVSAISNSTSCIVCHNLSEMKVSYLDNEFTQFSLASHYGKNRSDMRVGGSTKCGYCHQNGSTVFTLAMADVNNKNISNHSVLSTPNCTNAICHNSGKLHDPLLKIPISSNDSYCKTCHTTKNEHKTLYCTECHANNTDGSLAGREIHGIKFLQNDNTFSRSKTNATDCTTCHQSNVVDSSLGTFTAEKIGDFHHSNNLSNGTRWGNYWTTGISACLYCHNDTRHNSTPLGRPLHWNSSYQIRTSIGSGTNCADCHYKGDTNYGSMSSTFTTAGLQIAPEITNGSWKGKPGYFNHTLSEYTDLNCKSCHYQGTGTNVGQMIHNVSEGSAGGPDCKSCHDAGGSAPELVNFSAMNSSSAGHKSLNSGASATVNAENKKCWACHGDGTQPFGHPSNYKAPVNCIICHTGAGSYNAPKVTEHNQAGQDVITSVNCTQCHDNNGMYLGNTGIGTIIHYFKKVTNTATTPYGHLGPIDTSNCIDCHNGPNATNPDWGSPVNISISTKRPHTETSTAQCDACHKDASVATLADVDFHNAAIKPGAGGDNCLDCHANAE